MENIPAQNQPVAPQPPVQPTPSPQPVAPTPSTAESPKKPRSHWLLIVGLAVVVLLAGIGVGKLYSFSNIRLPNVPFLNPSPTPTPSVTASKIQSNLTVTQQIAWSHTSFGFSLLNQLASQDSTNNIIISPTSIALALSMTYLGAGGETKSAIAKTLTIENLPESAVTTTSAELSSTHANPNDGITINVANSIWQNKNFTLIPTYVSDLKKYFNAEASSLNFNDTERTMNTINGWVNQKTNGKIQKIINPPGLPPSVIAVLINAVYFKGSWTEPFDPKLTKQKEFTAANGTSKQVPMMEREDNFRYAETDQFQVVKLPYGKSELFSMYVFLPKQSLTEFRKMLTVENWNTWMEQITSRDGTLIMPSFKTKYEQNLNDVLKILGMEVAFTEQADFSRMISDKTIPYYISTVVHSAFIEVNEKGTEAAAVTAVLPMSGGGGEPIPPFSMIVNKPFLYAICDDTGEPYFLGIVNDP